MQAQTIVNQHLFSSGTFDKVYHIISQRDNDELGVLGALFDVTRND